MKRNTNYLHKAKIPTLQIQKKVLKYLKDKYLKR